MNRVWMITGAGRGLGHAFAEEAVKNGEKVIATVRKINDTDPLISVYQMPSFGLRGSSGKEKATAPSRPSRESSNRRFR